MQDLFLLAEELVLPAHPGQLVPRCARRTLTVAVLDVVLGAPKLRIVREPHIPSTSAKPLPTVIGGPGEA